MISSWILVIIVSICCLFYKWATFGFDFFEKRGIYYEKPWPFFGNAWKLIGNKSSCVKEIREFCQRNKNHKILGFFSFKLPIFLIVGPDYVKKIFVEDFQNFANHKPIFQSAIDPLAFNVVLNMKDQKWKDMRNTLTPAFTGSKMKLMFSLMFANIADSMSHLKEKSLDGGSFDIEFKEHFSRLSNDIIASTAFGLTVNSYDDPHNQFFRIGKSVTKFNVFQKMKFFLAMFAPWFMNLFRITIFDEESTDYFMDLVLNAMDNRERNNIVRPDMIHLLMEAKKMSGRQWSDIELAAQCFLFFFAAFENNATFICTTCQELMENPDIQNRLFEEIMNHRKEMQGEPLDYNSLASLKYLGLVLSESLRKWPLTIALDRVCSKDYKIYDEEGNLVVELKKGDNIWLPLIALHWNDDYYPKPEVFDPERFNDKNKHQIPNYAYLPFGVGPRSCIGNRFALMQAKAILYHLVLNFRIDRCDRSVKSLYDEMRGLQIHPNNGFWFTLVPRSLEQNY